MKFTHFDASLKQCRRRISVHEWRRRIDGYAPWTIKLKGRGGPIGWGGLYVDPFDLKWGPELGFFFHPAHHGHGYGLELACATLELADTKLKLNKISAFAHPNNEASNGLLRKVGFKKLFYVNEIQRNYFERARSLA